MNSYSIPEIERLVDALVKGAALELYLTPKPGLVDLADCGSHPDLSLATMESSIHSVADYLLELYRSLSRGERFEHQVAIAKRAERGMQSALGTNTHKGYLFLSGLLLIAHWHVPCRGERSLRATISSLAREFFTTRGSGNTNGHRVRQRFRAGGIVAEAMDGFPSLFDSSLPAFRASLARTGSLRNASFAMLARLMGSVEDTTTLHRGGPFALCRVRRDGARLERLLEEGDDCTPFLEGLNRLYILKGITMGGVADMLALSYGYLIFRSEIALNCHRAILDLVHGTPRAELSPRMSVRPASHVWFGQPLTAGLQYRVPPDVRPGQIEGGETQNVCHPSR